MLQNGVHRLAGFNGRCIPSPEELQLNDLGQERYWTIDSIVSGMRDQIYFHGITKVHPVAAFEYSVSNLWNALDDSNEEELQSSLVIAGVAQELRERGLRREQISRLPVLSWRQTMRVVNFAITDMSPPYTDLYID